MLISYLYTSLPLYLRASGLQGHLLLVEPCLLHDGAFWQWKTDISPWLRVMDVNFHRSLLCILFLFLLAGSESIGTMHNKFAHSERQIAHTIYASFQYFPNHRVLTSSF
ncbi:hypothetical protein BDZ91DRAFT_323185 [Kalaharituber pfeilii]|nr:hypothetical protein BDZ91DRAFT_323185 [Kalaharituber pfeilii]